MQTFEASRPTVGAQALGIARAAYEYALEYAKEREQFGRAIIENQSIAFTLADMKLEIDAARLLVWRAAWMGRTGQNFENAEGSMSKLKAGEVAVWATERAIQILGGNGYTREFPVERMHRDAKIYTIFEGTSEIQRLVISPRDLRRPRQITNLRRESKGRLVRAVSPAACAVRAGGSSAASACGHAITGVALALGATSPCVERESALTSARRLRPSRRSRLAAVTSFLSEPFLSGPGRLQGRGEALEAGLGEEGGEAAFAHLAFADVGVAVAAGAERGGGVVDVDGSRGARCRPWRRLRRGPRRGGLRR